MYEFFVCLFQRWLYHGVQVHLRSVIRVTSIMPLVIVSLQSHIGWLVGGWMGGWVLGSGAFALVC